jgi:tetratricopeptide (TPR) repeat protein
MAAARAKANKFGAVLNRALAAAAAALFLSSASHADDFDAALAEARTMLAAGQLAEATPMLESLGARRPSDFLVHYYLGYCYGDAKLFDAARAEYEKCVTLNADCPDAYYNLGVVLNELGLYDDASRAFEEALLLTPGRPDANFNCGLAHYYARRPVTAIKYYREARALAPDDLDILFYLALAYEEIDGAVASALWEEYLARAAGVEAEAEYVEIANRHAARLRKHADR